MDKNDYKPLWRALAYIKRYWGFIACGFVCTALVNAFTLLQPLLIKKVMDDVIFAGKTAAEQGRALDALQLVLLFFFLLLIGKGLFYFLQGYLIPCGVNQAVRDLRNDTFSHVQNLPLKTFDKFRTGDIMTRITNDADRLADVFGLGIINFLNDIIVLVFSIFLMFFRNWQMSCVVILISPVVAIAIGKFSEYVKNAVDKNQKQMSVIYNTIEESVSGVRTVKSFSMEKKEVDRFKRENMTLYGHIMNVIKFKVVQIPIVEVIAGLGISCAIGYGGLQIIAGPDGHAPFGLTWIKGYTVGEIFEVWGYMIMATNPLNRISQSIASITGTAVSAKRLFEILDSPLEEKEGKRDMPQIEGSIRFEDVSFGYSEDKPVLDGLNLEIEKGQTIAFVGHSGSGKTTTSALLARLYEPDSGRILIDGIDVSDVNIHSYRSQISVVPQETLLFTGTIRDNIAYARDDASLEEVIEAAKAANAHDFIMAMPDGYDTKVSERGSSLSGGQRQRIAIARALLRKSKILILDEATSSVDAISEKLIQESLERLFRDRTTIIIAHRVSTIQKADKIFVFDQGRIAESGTHSTLISAGGLYELLYKSYFKQEDDDGKERE